MDFQRFYFKSGYLLIDEYFEKQFSISHNISDKNLLCTPTENSVQNVVEFSVDTYLRLAYQIATLSVYMQINFDLSGKRIILIL